MEKLGVRPEVARPDLDTLKAAQLAPEKPPIHLTAFALAAEHGMWASFPFLHCTRHVPASGLRASCFLCSNLCPSICRALPHFSPPSSIALPPAPLQSGASAIPEAPSKHRPASGPLHLLFLLPRVPPTEVCPALSLSSSGSLFKCHLP